MDLFGAVFGLASISMSLDLPDARCMSQAHPTLNSH